MGGADGPEDGFFFGEARQDDACGMRMCFLQGAKQCCPVHAGHAHVRYDHIDLHAFGKFQCFGRTGCKDHLPVRPHAAQAPAQAVQDVLVIVNEQNLIH